MFSGRAVYVLAPLHLEEDYTAEYYFYREVD